MKNTVLGLKIVSPSLPFCYFFYFGVFTPFPIINESLKKRRDCVHFTIGAS